MPRKILSRPVKKGLLEVEVVCSLATRNYKVSASEGVSATVLRPVSAILDTGAVPNLIKETVLQGDWERYGIHGPPAFNIVGGGSLRLLQKGNITLTVQLGTIKFQARFIVVEGLAAECILGCQFIDRQVQTIHPKRKTGDTSQWQCYPDHSRLRTTRFRKTTYASEGVTTVDQIKGV
jgi:hypothetical protein